MMPGRSAWKRVRYSAHLVAEDSRHEASTDPAAAMARSAHQVAQGVLDAAMEGRVGVDHLPQPFDRDLGVHGEGEEAQHLAPVGAGATSGGLARTFQ